MTYSAALAASFNKLLHADLLKLSPFSLTQKIRQLHQTGEQSVKFQRSSSSLPLFVGEIKKKQT